MRSKGLTLAGTQIVINILKVEGECRRVLGTIRVSCILISGLSLLVKLIRVNQLMLRRGHLSLIILIDHEKVLTFAITLYDPCCLPGVYCLFRIIVTLPLLRSNLCVVINMSLYVIVTE